MVLWNFDLRQKIYGRLPNIIKLWFIMVKAMVIYQNNWSTALEIQFTMDITMVLWEKNFGTIHDSTQSDS